MIERAPQSEAPCTLLSPTPPVPTTTTSAPAGTCAVLKTAPRPVITPQESSDALSSGTSVGIATTCEACTVTMSAKAPVRIDWWIGSPPGPWIGPSASRRKLASHRTGLPWAQ